MDGRRGDAAAARTAEAPAAGRAVHPGGSRAARGRKAADRPVPERSASHAHLSLDELRDYRRVLGEEEGRVSYWRRILQARLDVVRAEIAGGSARPLDQEALRPVLADARVTAGRNALVSVLPVDDIPPLPRLEELWERQADPSDGEELAALEADLSAAERQLSEYRTVLHRRIGEATGDLIARYREQPALALSALPLPPERRAASR